MIETERAQFTAIFEHAALALNGRGETEWPWLMADILKLPTRLLPAVQLALAQGRWRNAKNPKAYIKTVAKREALKMGLVDNPSEQNRTLRIPDHVRDEDGRRLSHDGYIDYLSYDGPVKEAGVWHARERYEEADWTDDEGRVIPVVAGRPVPEALLVPDDKDPDSLVINWEKVAAQAVSTRKKKMF